MKYTIKELRADFPTDAACMAFIFAKRYPGGIECKCGLRAFYPVAGRRSYACACGFQVYPCEGTIFHKSATSLVSWFHAIFLMSQSKNGVSGKELQRQLGVTYKCAWRIGKQIRKLMTSDGGPLGGIVEVDETFVGGRRKGRGNFKGSHAAVVGSVERGGRIKLEVVPDLKTETILPVVQSQVKAGSEVMTDGAYAFRPLTELGYDHKASNHKRLESRASTGTIEGFWGHFKRSVSGTYGSVSEKHLPSYLNEFSFRYDHRKVSIPQVLFSRVGRPA